MCQNKKWLARTRSIESDFPYVDYLKTTDLQMGQVVNKNKQGQKLGRKGQETRARLMDAARSLLETQSPVELTAVAIAAEAGTSPASFYMYFDDTKDLLFALSEVAGQDMAKIHAIFDEPWHPDNLQQRAMDVIEALNAVWDKHRPVLRYRNLEATRGDQRFADLRLNTFIPFIQRLAECILAVNPAQGGRRRADAYAEASILQGAMEHMAATDPVVMERGLGFKRINENMARIVRLVMLGDQSALGAPAAPVVPRQRSDEPAARPAVRTSTRGTAAKTAVKSKPSAAKKVKAPAATPVPATTPASKRAKRAPAS
jgi:AcrR family transcriptional regulator